MRRTERKHPGYELEPDGKGVLFFLSLPLILAVLVFLTVSCDDPEREAATQVESSVPEVGGPRPEPQPLERVRLPEAAGAEEATPAPPEGPVDFGTAMEAYREGRHGDAATLFEAYLRSHPENPWGHYVLGLSAWKDGDLQGAEEALRDATELDAGHRKARVNLARVLLDGDRVDEARDAVDEALEIGPGAADALRVAGLVAEEEGRIEDAMEAYRRAILADPQDAWSMNNLGLIHIRRGAFEAAVPPLARAVELRDDVPVFRNNLGAALERTERYAAAAAAYRTADSLANGHEKARTSLTRVEEVKEARSGVEADLAALAGEFARTVERWRDERVAGTPAGPGDGPEDERPGAEASASGEEPHETDGSGEDAGPAEPGEDAAAEEHDGDQGAEADGPSAEGGEGGPRDAATGPDDPVGGTSASDPDTVGSSVPDPSTG